MVRLNSALVVSLLIFALLWASRTDAQQRASSLSELKVLAATESTVTVTDTKGQTFRGIIVDASDSLLSLRIGSTVRRFDTADVQVIGVRQEDSVANGTLIGAAVGGGLTSLLFLDNECRDDPACYGAVGVYAGVGSLIGLGIDALVHRTVDVYVAPWRGARRSLRVVPMVVRGRRGASVTVAF